VVEKHIRGDSLYIRCVADEKESLLITRFAEIISGKSASNQAKLPAALLRYFVSFYLPVCKNELERTEVNYIHFLVRNQNKIVQMSYDILKPPPCFL
jgi:hypothetical protein